MIVKLVNADGSTAATYLVSPPVNYKASYPEMDPGPGEIVAAPSEVVLEVEGGEWTLAAEAP